jgi:hypothetical protein
VPADPNIRLASASGRWLIVATVAGSGIAFLDTTVVNVALPTSATTWAAAWPGCSGPSTPTW